MCSLLDINDCCYNISVPDSIYTILIYTIPHLVIASQLKENEIRTYDIVE